ncbi:MAG TPA: peptide ABC transporter substrate-binding protein [Pyrinomonadaceae bacterium]|jgi:ABC-type oligopeptide transport system substrate-binding subunit|nr:peptide ABC transporter substrate-binding protein [Pyrinomonadaceae bacterium]
MARFYLRQLIAATAIASFVFGTISCRVVATPGDFYGNTTPPKQNVLRYVNGDEPESLDPPISTGQPEARIYMALYQGLVDYDPKTLNAIPALAERWDINNDSSEFVFHLRRNAVWSNRDPIDAHDFVYSIRRGLSPALASKNAYLAYYINYAEAYNRKAAFARDPKTKQFVLEKDLDENAPAAEAAQSPTVSIASEYDSGSVGPESLQGPDVKASPAADSALHQLMHSPLRLTLPEDETARNKLLAKNPKLQAAVQDKEFVAVSAEDIGVEAVDDYTVRISLSQPAAYFLGVLAHQLFRLVPRKIIEQYGEQWTDPKHIVTCGPFKLKQWLPYSELVVERDPVYWDAANVHLDEIHFFVSADNPTSLNLYKVGEADAVLNHCVPNAWLRVIRPKKDYMDGAEAAIGFININVTKAPMNDVRVRRAFNMAIDKINYSKSRFVTKSLSAFTPEGIFVGYTQPKGEGFDPERARKLLGEAGFPVTKQDDGSFQCKAFPTGEVEYIFNTNSSNKAMAEFMQAQWKQNLGITVPLRSMESKTFLNARNKLEYKGFAVGLWGADYMDPFTFLGLFSTPDGSNGSGWYDLKYVAMLNEANRTLDRQQRYDLLAKAEKYVLDHQPVIPIETFAVNWLKKPYVKGMYPNAASLYPWKFVYIERDPAKWDYSIPSLAD